ncbi:MAG: DUF2236 domain-containing protein [bacterium]|nr:DUF2236 domain-containing protein [bacterium]
MQLVHYPALAERARSQRTALPAVYGKIDFDKTPFRFTRDPADRSALPAWVAPRRPLLDDERAVELVRSTTMLGDVVADRYAALLGRYGLQELVGMLRQACREGVECVPGAPDELRALIASMEARPTWLDMDLVEEGARHLRVSAAYLSPFLIRGAFLATFLNSYAALPMALTGALSERRAAFRINETASFFAVTTLPGALDRHQAGFEAAAMVRLMHSIVRFNALTRSDRWDVDVYGVPVPQIDQVPAGMVNVYLLAMRARRRGRTTFDARERVMLEFSRYRAYLLGLPEELLPATQDDVIRVVHARAACLRDDFDTTCHALVGATMEAYLRPTRTPFDRAFDAVEKSWSKMFLLGFRGGDRKAAAAMGVPIRAADFARVALTAPFILGRFTGVRLASRLPLLRNAVDGYTVRLVGKRLAAYGRPEYTTDPSTYRG